MVVAVVLLLLFSLLILLLLFHLAQETPEENPGYFGQQKRVHCGVCWHCSQRGSKEEDAWLNGRPKRFTPSGFPWRQVPWGEWAVISTISNPGAMEHILKWVVGERGSSHKLGGSRGMLSFNVCEICVLYGWKCIRHFFENVTFLCAFCPLESIHS